MLEWKVGVFTVGAGMALIGIYLEQRWLTGGAIVVLVAGALVGFQFGTHEEDTEVPESREEEGDLEG